MKVAIVCPYQLPWDGKTFDLRHNSANGQRFTRALILDHSTEQSRFLKAAACRERDLVRKLGPKEDSEVS